MNEWIGRQCQLMKNSLDAFRSNLRFAAERDDGVVDKQEAKAISEIMKDVERLEKTLDRYAR